MNQPNTTTIPVFTIREIRRMARRQLSGRWLRALPAMLIYVLLVSLPGVFMQVGTYLTSDLPAMLETAGSAELLPPGRQRALPSDSVRIRSHISV